MSHEHPQFTDVLEELRTLTLLLEDPQPGLASWWGFVNLTRMKLLTLLQEAEEKADEAAETDGDRIVNGGQK